MTLPTSRNRTYTPGMEVPSADLNAIQDWIIEGNRRNDQAHLNIVARGLYEIVGDGVPMGFTGAGFNETSNEWVLGPSGTQVAQYRNSSRDWAGATGTITNGVVGSATVKCGLGIVVISSGTSGTSTQRHMTSTNEGQAYTLRTTPGPSVTQRPALAFDGSLFLMKPENTNSASYSSPDGITWTTKGTSTVFWGISTNSPGGTVAAIDFFEGAGSANRVITTSDAGANWQANTIAGTGVLLKGIFYDTETALFWMCGVDNSLPAVWSAVTPSGTWTKRTITIDAYHAPTSFQSICRYAGFFVVSAGSTYGYFVSKDGLAWTEVPMVGSTQTVLLSTPDGQSCIRITPASAAAEISPEIFQ